MSSGTDCILNGSWNHFPDSWWDHHTGNFHKNFGMRIDHLLVTGSLKHRVVCAEIDREARSEFFDAGLFFFTFPARVAWLISVVRASNEGSLRPRVARAQGMTSLPAHPLCEKEKAR